MVSPSSYSESPISGMRLSSVVPAKQTGNKDHPLTDLDLAVKLHYVRAVYFFDSEPVRGLTINDLKTPMFKLLDIYFTAAGRIRRSETTGRPFLKCNDGGVRVVEAFCDKTIDDWLNINGDSRDNCLAYYQTLGPDLPFSPPVLVQFTWFKCGGVSLGLSWAHIIGDPISASTFVNKWALILAGHIPIKSLHSPKPRKSETPVSLPGKSSPMKRVEPVGDHWKFSNNCKMETQSFQITSKQLAHMASRVCAPANVSHFEVLSAVIWKSLSKFREDSGPRVVTICAYNNLGNRENDGPTNDLVLSTIGADFNVRKVDISELAVLIADKKRVDGNSLAEEIFSEEESESSDLIVYGANLTFVNMEEADVYGLKLQGKKPVFVNYAIDGVGNEGIVMILRGPDEEDGCGRTVTVVLPQDQLTNLEKELNQEWSVA